MNKISSLKKVLNDIKNCDAKGIHLYHEKERILNYYPYAELYKRAANISHALQYYGIKSHDKVLICAKTCIEFIVIWLGLILIEAVPVPMPPKEALVGEKTFSNRIKKVLPYFSYYICHDNEIQELAEIVADSAKKIKIIPFAKIFAEKINTNRSTVSNYDYLLNNIAFIQFTSGTTDDPKGIMITYKNLLANIYAIWCRWEINIRIASWLPLYHDMGLIGYFLGGLFTQTDLILISPQQFAKRPMQFLDILSKYAVQITCLPNFALEWILRRYDDNKKYDFSLEALTVIGVGAEPINIDTLRRFEETFVKYGLKKGVLSPCYGLAEATLAVTLASPFTGYLMSKKIDHCYPTVGKVLPNLDVKIEKIDNNDFGIIKVKGESVAEQMLVKRKTLNTLDKDDYYHTKDLGYFDHDLLVIMGRVDDMFIINGENFFPHEIEHHIRHIDGISRNRVVCFYAKVPNQLDKLILIYETKETKKENIKQTKLQIEKLILKNVGIKLDEIIAVAPKTIPVTPSGKTMRNKIKNRYYQKWKGELI